MSFIRGVEEAFVDNAADRIVNDILPGNGTGLIGGTLQTGVDQFVNNEINREFGGGLGSGNGYAPGGGFF